MLKLMKGRLASARGQIVVDADGAYYTNALVELGSVLHIATALEQAVPPGLKSAVFDTLDSLWRLLASLEKVDFQRDLLAKGLMDESQWMRFIERDIDSFYVTLRSLFDHLARAIRAATNTPKELPSSFNALRSKASSNYRRQLGADLVALLERCDWFDDQRLLRDDLVHSAARTMVFPDPDRVLYQVSKGLRNKVMIRKLMYNENVADFELVSGLIMAELLVYLDRVGRAIAKRTKSRIKPAKTKSYHPGLHALLKGLDKLASL